MMRKPSLQQRWGDYRPAKSTLLWSCVICVVVTIVVGFNWGGWVTGGTAAKMTEAGRAQMAAEYCAANFAASAGAGAQLASLKKASGWAQGELITKGGWDVLPGSREPLPGVADLCAKRLLVEKVLLKKAQAAPG